MPRKARERSSTGIYHIMIRGINSQDIFYDDEDRIKFIEILKKYKTICEYKVYGYCLMSNHTHLLINEGKETISQIMKRIGASYVYWYNTKYERCGHLFQDRYKSEVVENDKYLLVVLRYIHQNPIKAGIVKKIEKYKWSSYKEYVNQKDDLTDINFIFDIINPDSTKAVKIFVEFMKRENEEKCLDVEFRKRKQLSDENVRKLITELLQSENIQTLRKMNKKERNKIIKELKDRGATIRQLARVTGLGRGIIEKA